MPLLRRWPALVLTLSLPFSLAAAPAHAQSSGEPDSQTTWGGLFTTAQASTGISLYNSRCSSCHRSDLSGGNGPALTFGPFGATWEGQPVSALVARIQSSMPPTDPGSLTDSQAAAIVASLLQRQGYPAGSATLSPSASSVYRTHRLSPLTWAAPIAGGQKSISVTAAETGNGWSVTQRPAWLSSSITGATGTGTVTLIASANASGVSRSAAVLIGNRPITVTQEAAATAAVPATPGNFQASITGQTVTFTWSAPAAGPVPSSYRIEAGESADYLGVSLDVGAVTSHAVPQVPVGSYAARIRAGNAAGFGEPTAVIPVVVAAAPPGMPRHPLVTVTGSTVRVIWEAPASGPAPTGYLVEAGSAAGRIDYGAIAVTAPVLEVPNVPDGRYFLRVRAVAGNTPGAATTDVIADVVPDLRSPGTPAALDVTVVGRTVTLCWSASTGGAPAAAYVLEVGSSSGASDLFPGFEWPASSTTFEATSVLAGEYYVRVRARSAAGVLSSPSPEARVIVSGSY